MQFYTARLNKTPFQKYFSDIEKGLLEKKYLRLNLALKTKTDV